MAESDADAVDGDPTGGSGMEGGGRSLFVQARKRGTEDADGHPGGSAPPGRRGRPAVRIMEEVGQVLNVLRLVTRCKRNRMLERAFTFTSALAFTKMWCLLQCSIGDITWLLNVSVTREDGAEHLGLPPIVTTDPMLGLMWEQIARLQNGSPEGKADAAASLVSLAQDNERNVKLIVEEGGIAPLLKLVKDGTVEGQEAAAEAIGILGRDPEGVRQMIPEGLISAFVEVLKDGPIEVQSKVAWALSELVSNNPELQDHFAQSGVVIRFLVGHLAFERECEDPALKASMKTEAARVLWMLAKNNVKNCKAITESNALLCFAILLEKESEEAQYNSAMAVMAVAEENTDLRRSAFKPNCSAAIELLDQLLRIIEEGDSKLAIPCIRAIGCLARTFPAGETRVIAPLVKQLDHRELPVAREAAIALGKFISNENFLHLEHSRVIIESLCASHLILLVYFGDGIAQIPALVLLCYLALHVSDSEALARAEALSALEWASKKAALIQDPLVEKLLLEAKSRLELYQSRGFRFV